MSEPAVEPVDGVEPVEGEEPEWSGISQEDWQATQERLARADALVQAAEAQQRGGGPLADYDPEFRQELEQFIDQKLGPYSSFQQEQVLGEAEQRAQDILHDLSVRDGEFDTATARLRADALLPQMSAKYGQGPKAAEAALAAAASEQRAWEAKVREDAVTAYQNQLRGISSTPREPAATVNGAAAQHVTPQGGDELDLVRSYFPSR